LFGVDDGSFLEQDIAKKKNHYNRRSNWEGWQWGLAFSDWEDDYD
jgi:hypothetical protein